MCSPVGNFGRQSFHDVKCFCIIPLSTLETTSFMDDPKGSAIWSEKLHHNPWCEDYYPIMIRQFWFFLLTSITHVIKYLGKIRYDKWFNEACNKMLVLIYNTTMSHTRLLLNIGLLMLIQSTHYDHWKWADWHNPQPLEQTKMGRLFSERVEAI